MSEELIKPNFNPVAETFAPKALEITLEDKTYKLLYSMVAFVEMEKMYPSVDHVLQMLLGGLDASVNPKVTYCGATCLVSDIAVNGEPLMNILVRTKTQTAKFQDTLNLLWLGCLHDHVIFDEVGEIKGYTITKAELAQRVTFKNMREVNAKIVAALLRDLVPAVEQDKNTQGNGPQASSEAAQ